MVLLSEKQIKQFQQKILSWYKKNKRDLPWRRTRDPYSILISEVMSQQTQLSRVIPKYLAWIEKFPTIEDLAKVSTREVLTAWSGLGYNRRALYVQKAAKEIVENFNGEFPTDIETLKKLPGIGDYTAKAIACFAFDQQIAVVDTNVRRVILTQIQFSESSENSDFQKTRYIRISDNQTDRSSELSEFSGKMIQQIADQLLPVGRAYEWNQALMDYAAAELKKEKIPIPKQSHFKTSDRYYRGQIIKLLIRYQQLYKDEIFDLLDKQQGFDKERLEKIINGLIQDRFIREQNNYLNIV